MEDTNAWLQNAFSNDTHESRHPSAANEIYFANIAGNELHVGQHHGADVEPLKLASVQLEESGYRRVLAFSTVRPSLLAIGTRTGVAIYDVATTNASPRLLRSDRALTALAWSSTKAHNIALGHIDGRVSIWDCHLPNGPLHSILLGHGSCNALSWSNGHESILAASAGNVVSLWHVSTTARRIGGYRTLDAPIRQIVWHPGSSNVILTAGANGSISIWDIASDLQALAQVDLDEDGLFGELEDVNPPSAPLHQVSLDQNVQDIRWLGDHGILVLADGGKKLLAFGFHKLENPQSTTWEEAVDPVAAKAILLPHQGAVALLSPGLGADRLVSLPFKVVDELDLKPGLYQGVSNGDVSEELSTHMSVNQHSGQPAAQQTMKPIPISLLQGERGTFSRTAQQMRVFRKKSSAGLSARPGTKESAQSEDTGIQITAPLTSSPELPRPTQADDDSPMPFLSPTIPSRKASPSARPSVDDTLTLPPPPNESFDSLPSTANADSDSDDETFDGAAMVGSGNLMLPGGVNVPLPKSCGALFAPNGQLVTYFPPKPRNSSKADDLNSEETYRSAKVARTFPTFGNLGGEHLRFDDDGSDSDSTAALDDAGYGDITPLELPSSTPENTLWQKSFSPTKASTGQAGRHQSVQISIRKIEGLSGLHQELAQRYSLMCRVDADGEALAQTNAQVASNAGLAYVAELWSLLAHVLSTKNLGITDDTSGESATIDFGVNNGISLRPTSKRSSTSTGDHRELLIAAQMLGETWLAEQVLSMAEATADLQTLGSIAAVLLSTREAKQRSYQVSQSSNRDRSAAQHARQLPPRPIPLLRNDSRDSDLLCQSPAKSRHNSHASSRNPSQPSTPGLNSLSTTPPYPFPNLSRHGSRVSGSGSASPETHRSSFSAAAKYYAQSITEKFSNYGTSPPAKRLGTSPGNELSTSLPTGSWGKSVSFASDTGTAQESRQSRAQSSRDDGYDSDRTIEDGSLPHTPKSGTGEITFIIKGADLAEKTGGPSVSSLPIPPPLSPTLLAKARIWVRSYAEQLRTWDMIISAAELEQLAGTRDSNASAPSESEEGIVPIPIPGQRKPTCSICSSKIDGLRQSCSQCLHTTHLSCLTGYLQELEDAGFECPTGCGCRCAELPCEEVQWADEDDGEDAAKRSDAVRKRSLTDPRVWRARIEGASW